MRKRKRNDSGLGFRWDNSPKLFIDGKTNGSLFSETTAKRWIKFDFLSEREDSRQYGDWFC